jgi:DNA-3-methyladenine glycosylase II
MTTIHIAKPANFSLRAAAEFFAGFLPGSGMAAVATDHLTLAFRLDRSFDAVAVALREEGDTLVGACTGATDSSAVARQVSRILGLDADAEAWLALGRREPLVGRLQGEFPGFLTAAKSSPYDAAAWAVIAHRMPMAAASKLKSAIAEQHGDVVSRPISPGRAADVELGDGRHWVFPSPRALLRVDRVHGLSDEKLARLHGIARAALEGRLDAERLRSMGPARAVDELQSLRGVGPWTASHIYFRGAAPHDDLPMAEPRVLHGFAHATGMKATTEEAFVRASAGWRPFRMWVCVLLSRHLARAGGWNAPGLARERQRASQRARA